MTTTKLTYRVYEDQDLPGILQLWEQYSGWGAITEEQFASWYLHTPYGRCLVIVAVDEENNVFGQVVFIPCIIYQNGKLVKGLKVSSPILNDQARDTNIKDYDHPAYAMLRHGTQEAKMLNYEIVYMFPSKGWTHLLKTFPKYNLPEPHIALYDCFAISLETKYSQPDTNIRISVAQEPYSQEFDELWSDAILQFPLLCAVKRNAEWLQWKIAGHMVFEARHIVTNSLIGYTAINKNSGLIVDMLARTKEDLSSVITSVIYSLHISNAKVYPTQIKKLTGMLTPILQLVLKNIIYEKEDFTFAFGCYSLQNSDSFQKISPSSWYMMPND